MSTFDYIVIGSGSAGSVLANRLSADPADRVLLIEAGGRDRNPMIHIPKGFAKLLDNPDYAWQYPTKPFGSSGMTETWVRGKTLGGSSSINGMVYNRGHAADYDEIVDRGNPGWGWDEMLPRFRRLEDHELGASETRGAGGPLRVSVNQETEETCDAVIASAALTGMRPVDDINGSDDERIGYSTRTIKDGRRFSGARAHVNPVESRPNLEIAFGAAAERILFEGDRAVGVRVRQDGNVVEFRARREVIVSAGSLGTPKLLQLSGIGDAGVLRAAGVDVRVDSPNVGGRMYEHRCIVFEHRLNRNLGYNRKLYSPARQALTGARYLLDRKGPLSTSAYDVVGFFKAHPDAERVDAQMLMAPFSAGPHVGDGALDLENRPGMQTIAYVLRPTSSGSVHISSSDPDAPLDIQPEFLTTDYDRTTMLGIVSRLRAMFADGPIADLIGGETVPGSLMQDDDELIESSMVNGHCGYHAVATCAMGVDDDDPVDSQCRVRGVDGLRVVDTSMMPTMVSGNLNGPMMAMAWRAADMILEDRPLPVDFASAGTAAAR